MFCWSECYLGCFSCEFSLIPLCGHMREVCPQGFLPEGLTTWLCLDTKTTYLGFRNKSLIAKFSHVLKVHSLLWIVYLLSLFLAVFYVDFQFHMWLSGVFSVLSLHIWCTLMCFCVLVHWGGMDWLLNSHEEGVRCVWRSSGGIDQILFHLYPTSHSISSRSLGKVVCCCNYHKSRFY